MADAEECGDGTVTLAEFEQRAAAEVQDIANSVVRQNPADLLGTASSAAGAADGSLDVSLENSDAAVDDRPGLIGGLP